MDNPSQSCHIWLGKLCPAKRHLANQGCVHSEKRVHFKFCTEGLYGLAAAMNPYRSNLGNNNKKLYKNIYMFTSDSTTSTP